MVKKFTNDQSILTLVVTNNLFSALLMALALGVFFISAQLNTALDTFSLEAKKTERLVMQSAEYAASTKDSRELDNVVKHLLREYDVYSMEIRLNSGNLLYKKTSPKSIDAQYLMTITNDIISNALVDTHSTSKNLSMIGEDVGNEGLEGIKLGVLKIQFSRESIENQRREIINTGIFIILLVFALVGLIAYLMSKAIIKPINGVVSVIEKWRSGIKDVRISNDVGGEIGLLSKELNAMKDDINNKQAQLHNFMARITHELRSPAQQMIGYTERAKYLGQPSAATKECLETILGAGRQMSSVIDDILDFEKIEAGKFKTVNESFNVSDLIHQLISSHSVLSDNRGLDLFPEFQGPEALRNSDIVGEKIKLVKILNNLISNAIKFTKSPGYVTVFVKWEKTSDTALQLVIKVKDTGIGIPAEHIDSVLMPFQQIASQSGSKVQGTGLGLTIVKELTEQMGGKLNISSNVGIGTTVTVTLPFEYIESNEIEIPNVIGTSAVSYGLVVDDSSSELLSGHLRHVGHLIDSASHGIEALNKFEVGKYSFIVMDLNMPFMDGIEATKRIRKLENAAKAKQTPIIVVTCDATEDTRQRCLSAGVNDFVAKPITTKQLLRVVGKHCLDLPNNIVSISENVAEKKQLID